MNRALEIFSEIPKTRNCAQSVAAGFERSDLVLSLASMGGGRAPGGQCGALYAALMLVPPDKRAALLAEFIALTGAELCRDLKKIGVPCAKSVKTAADLVEKYR